MTVIALTSLKGGVGKSSTTVLLASEAHARGWPFVLVDLDPQGTSSRWWGPSACHMPRPTVAEIKALDRPGLLVLLDPPPGESPGAGVALEAADKVIAVTGPSWIELEAMPTLEAIVDLDGVILTRFDGRKVVHREAQDRLTARYGDRLLTTIPLRTEIEQAAAARRPPLRSSEAAQTAAVALDRLAAWRS